ncbi:unnamed protein product [Cylicostephanus goldi]|uniref:Mitochondrial carrier protein n=1 Tax=Cylicostephanus goldi TaxID=71465 RepID=A0A3P7PR72_CYLGO|nr:unnamed protein product [Cylicostephanus goldi]
MERWRSVKIGKGLYSGSAVNLVLITPEKAIKLVANDFFRYHLAVPGQTKLSTTRGAIAGAGAGALQIIITTPMELLKIQLQDQGRTGAKTKDSEKWMLKGPRKKDGSGDAVFWTSFCAGMTAGAIASFSVTPLDGKHDVRDCNACKCSMLKGPRKKDGSGDAVFWTSFCAGMTAGAIASFSVTPLDVAKTRIQTIRKKAHELVYKNVAQALYSILRTEGVRALFKGAACRVMAVAPLFAIAQTVYYIGVAEKILGIKKATHV